MTARSFVDTNVLVYAADASSGVKGEEARRLLLELGHSNSAVISVQVLRELYDVAVRKLKMNPVIARNLVSDLRIHNVVTEDEDLVCSAIEISILDQVSFWNSLIVAAAVRAGCQVLLSEDMADGQVINGVRIENPFRDLVSQGPKVARERRAAYRTIRHK